MNLKSQPPLLIYQSSEWVSFACLKIACCSRQRAIISLCYSNLILMKKMESTELWTLDLFRMLLIMQPKREKEVLIKVLCEISQRLLKKKRGQRYLVLPFFFFFLFLLHFQFLFIIIIIILNSNWLKRQNHNLVAPSSICRICLTPIVLKISSNLSHLRCSIVLALTFICGFLQGCNRSGPKCYLLFSYLSFDLL